MKSIVLATFILALVPVVAFAQKPQGDWENLRQLIVGQKIEVVDVNLKSLKGTFAGFTDEAILLRVGKGEVAVERAKVMRVSSRENSKRARNTLIGLGVGAAAGLAAGAIAGAGYHEDGETGVFMLVTVPIGTGIGAAVGAAMPAGHQTVYRAPSRELASAR